MKKAALVVVVLAVLCTGGWLYWWWHGPAYGTVTQSNNSDETAVLGSDEVLISWQGPFFTTRYPSTLRLLTSNEIAQGNMQAQYLLSAVTPTHQDQVAVTVGRLGVLRLDELPAVKLRRMQSDVYSESSRSFAPDESIVFTKTKDFETGIYWADGDRYAEVVASGSSTRRAELENALEVVMTSWQWQ
ncbi:hypothetical protein JNM87_04965 [Candidatus Saccharibacteria bacterium]|nr:hypothetical protein [Candidatus Saccharibacteria bacterium]